MAPRKIVQLFNMRQSQAPGPIVEEDKPRHQRGETILVEAGFVIETIPIFKWPWNPLAKRHNALAGLDFLRALKVLLTRRDAFAVCAHMESAVFLLLLRRLFFFRPLVVVWEVPWSPGWTFRERLQKLALPRADMNVVFSSNQIPLIHRLFGARTAARFVPFCVDTDFFRPSATPLPENSYVLSTGVDFARDFELILEAMEGSSAPVLLKPGKPLAVDPARNPGVTVLDRYLSYVEYRAMYQAASIVVVTTKESPHASGVTSLLEGMAMGKPVIVSDNPALRDYLPPPDAGVVVAVGDAAGLRKAIDDLLENPDRAAAMGRRAREYMEQHFTPERHFHAVADLFSGLRAG